MLTARPPCRRVPDITNVILAREVIVCVKILLLGARYDPADLGSPKGRQDMGQQDEGRQDRCAHRALRCIKTVELRASATGRPKRSVTIFRDGVHGQRR
jgi:hypothetical protein